MEQHSPRDTIFCRTRFMEVSRNKGMRPRNSQEQLILADRNIFGIDAFRLLQHDKSQIQTAGKQHLMLLRDIAFKQFNHKAGILPCESGQDLRVHINTVFPGQAQTQFSNRGVCQVLQLGIGIFLIFKISFAFSR